MLVYLGSERRNEFRNHIHCSEGVEEGDKGQGCASQSGAFRVIGLVVDFLYEIPDSPDGVDQYDKEPEDAE